MVEKRLENSTKEADDKLDKMQQKLDEINITMKKKEKYVKFVINLCTYLKFLLIIN